MVCNRDERIARTPALSPAWQTTGVRSMLAPIDTEGGGTWIGVNDAGIVAVLLNRSISLQRPGMRTRGDIVPRLLAADTLQRLVEGARGIDPFAFNPFRAVALHGRGLVIAASDGARLTIDTWMLDAARMFTSSSLGDDEAERRRAPLFATLVERARDPLRGQRAFHDHRWRACPAFSVRMARGDARTVSRSVIDLRSDRVTFTYEPLVDDPDPTFHIPNRKPHVDSGCAIWR